MNLLTSSIETLERRNLASVLFKIFLGTYILYILACASKGNPAPFSTVGFAAFPELLIGWSAAAITGFVILRMLWDLGKGRFLCSANVQRLRTLAILAGVNVFLNLRLSLTMESRSLSATFVHMKWQLEISDWMGRLKGPLDALLLFFLWYALSVLLSDAIRIEAENREAI